MDSKNKFKLYLPALHADGNGGISLIAADIRREVTYFALYNTENNKVNIQKEATYTTKDFASFSDMANRFIADHSLSNIAKIAVAVPGPVIAGKSEPQRLFWKLDAEEIKRQTNVNKVYLINDLEASAYGLGNDDESCFLTIHNSDDFVPGNVAVLAPGAGLGEAGLFWDGECLRPFATEGGHCEFSPRTSDEVEFYQFLQKIYGIVTWESVLSTSGLFNIYRFLRDVKQQKQPEWLTKEIEAGNFTEAIINGALEKRDRICNMTIDTFIIFLAREANSLVLKLKATGGLFLTGDIPVMLQKFLNNDKFYKNFIVSDKMEVVLKDIPIYLVKDQKTIINGAALYAAFYEE
ncbi:glucokinase [Chryseobacterium sp. HSC-36S06]|uniref:glucokinase n=1 Tax=Chryseobacterium sp. HSC-36S06 TaxID=2910970 RepID=UPI00209F6649|nr:glucokinase [Chryseobacterium sp. HSC-36S06]MCP2038617.1 glucokinase [Chryseobacterium sp. HSC-36S06]